MNYPVWQASSRPIRSAVPKNGCVAQVRKLLPRRTGGNQVGERTDLHPIEVVSAGRDHKGGKMLLLKLCDEFLRLFVALQGGNLHDDRTARGHRRIGSSRRYRPGMYRRIITGEHRRGKRSDRFGRSWCGWSVGFRNGGGGVTG